MSAANIMLYAQLAMELWKAYRAWKKSRGIEKSWKDLLAKLVSVWKLWKASHQAPPDSTQAPSVSVLAPRETWAGPAEMHKLVGLASSPYGWLASVSNVYRQGFKSAIYRNGEKIYQGSQETIGMPFQCADITIFPVEHGGHCLIFGQNGVGPGAAAPGHWSIAGAMFAGKALLAYNNDYTAKKFRDKPLLQNVLTSRIEASLPIYAIPTSMVEFRGRLYVAHSFGEVGVLEYPTGRRWYPDACQLAVCDGVLYAGGGAGFGVTGLPSVGSGLVWRFDGNDWTTVLNSGSAAIAHMVADGKRLWIAAVDPDALWMIAAGGSPVKVAEFPGETAADKGRSFGAAVAIHGEKILFGRSDKTRAHVYEVE